MSRPSLRNSPVLRALFLPILLITSGLVGCSTSQPAYCDDLEAWMSFDDLSAAITAGDENAAAAQLEALQELARSAPDEIAEDMDEIVATTADVVALGLTNSDSTADELERERVNRRLARVVENTTAVSAWAETECGIRLD